MIDLASGKKALQEMFSDVMQSNGFTRFAKDAYMQYDQKKRLLSGFELEWIFQGHDYRINFNIGPICWMGKKATDKEFSHSMLSFLMCDAGNLLPPCCTEHTFCSPDFTEAENQSTINHLNELILSEMKKVVDYPSCIHFHEKLPSFMRFPHCDKWMYELCMLVGSIDKAMEHVRNEINRFENTLSSERLHREDRWRKREYLPLLNTTKQMLLKRNVNHPQFEQYIRELVEADCMPDFVLRVPTNIRMLKGMLEGQLEFIEQAPPVECITEADQKLMQTIEYWNQVLRMLEQGNIEPLIQTIQDASNTVAVYLSKQYLISKHK